VATSYESGMLSLAHQVVVCRSRTTPCRSLTIPPFQRVSDDNIESLSLPSVS